MEQVELTKSQRDAIESVDTSMAVIAGAGSGKTLVLIERCLKAIEEASGGIDRLLAITFTEKAAAELIAKLKVSLPNGLNARLSSAWIGTFHAFCARVLKAHAPLISLPPSFRILDENGSRLMSRRAVEESFLALLDRGDKSAAHLVEEMEYQNATGLLEELMSFRWHADRIFQTKENSDERERKLIDAASHCYTAAKARLHEHLARMASVDFQELEIQTLNLFESRPEILASYRKRFRHILVDEYQDTNDIQAKLVALLHDSPNNRLFIVGDPRQSIYRFRGANVSCFASTVELIHKAHGHTANLSENFRSRPGIINFVNRFSAPIEEALFKSPKGAIEPADLSLVATRSDDGHPHVTVLSCASGDEAKVGEQRAFEAQAIARHINSLVNDGAFGFSDIACLFQAITSADVYEAAFRRHGIPCRVFGGRHLLERTEVTDLLSGLAYAANPANDTALLALMRSPLIGLSDDECTELAGPDGKHFRSAVLKHKRAAPLLSKLRAAKLHRRPSEILRLILEETGYEIFCAEIDPSGGRLANIDRLVTLAQSLEREELITLSAFVDFISTLRKESARLGDPPASSESSGIVRCMTVHAAKGLEFPVVILPDLIRHPVISGGAWAFVRGKGLGFKWRDRDAPYGPMLPSDNYKTLLDDDRQEEIAENSRLLYVAMTRAREKLVIPIHDCEKSKGRWHAWLKPLASDGVETIEVNIDTGAHIKSPPSAAMPSCIRPISSDANVRQLSLGRIFTVSQLESFDRCPQEYYLKYVLSLPAEMILGRRESGIPANIRGSITHGVIESLAPGKPQDIEELIRQQCLAHQVSPDAAAVREIMKPLDTFIKDPIFAELGKGQRELRFDWRFGKDTITGKIDWLRPVDSSREIVDFKTDRISEEGIERRAASYHLQMDAYALAMEAADGRDVKRTRLHFLSVGKSHTLAMDADRRERAMARITSILGRIESSDFDLGEFVPPCAETDCTCPYHLNELCWLDRHRR